jgi:hypothetical protein
MRVKHTKGGNEFNVEYLDWHNEYIKTGIYKNFHILKYDGVVELNRIMKNGEINKSPQSLKVAKDSVMRFPKEFSFVNELSFETYNNWLVPKNYKSSQNHFLNKIRYIIFEKIKPKTILKPIWKLIVIIILGSLSTFFGYILIEIYNNF